jgi:hypothetical protein
LFPPRKHKILTHVVGPRMLVVTERTENAPAVLRFHTWKLVEGAAASPTLTEPEATWSCLVFM